MKRFLSLLGLLFAIAVLIAGTLVFPASEFAKNNPKEDPNADFAPPCDYCDP